MTTMEKVFEQYRKMIDDMHLHVFDKGFFLEHLDRDGRVGFRCTKTEAVWHMNAQVWEDSAPDLVKESYESDEGKELYLKSLEALFSQPHQQTKKTCIAHGCVRAPKKDKKGFCGWCFKKFEKGLYTEEGIKIRSWKEIKADVSPRMTIEKLKGFAEAHPEYTITFGCPTLHHFVDPIVCIGRQFVHDKKQCKKCELHRDKIEDLESYLDSCNKE